MGDSIERFCYYHPTWRKIECPQGVLAESYIPGNSELNTSTLAHNCNKGLYPPNCMLECVVVLHVCRNGTE